MLLYIDAFQEVAYSNKLHANIEVPFIYRNHYYQDMYHYMNSSNILLNSWRDELYGNKFHTFLLFGEGNFCLP